MRSKPEAILNMYSSSLGLKALEGGFIEDELKAHL